MAMELRAGARVAEKYRIERLLGRGAVGSVYAAEHIETNKRVALKCVDLGQALDPAAAERLVREAQAAARVRHPNVVDVYDVGSEGKLVFLVMEYLEGEPLTALIARRDLPVYRLIAQLLPAMRGVAEAHRQGVIHRDIKPENIFMARQLDAPEPIAKVLDFGISKLDARGRKLRTLTADGFAIGTPGYMAYEQALGDRTVDGRADVYAFGAILYEALTGRVPHAAGDFPSLVKHFLSGSVATPIALRPDLPPSLSALVMWAIERERSQRIPSMEAMIRELEPFATERGYRAEQAGAAVVRPDRGRTLVGPWALAPKPPPTTPAEPAGRSSAPSMAAGGTWLQALRRRRALRGLLIALTASLLALVGFSLASRAAQPQRPLAPRRPTVQAAPARVTTRLESAAAQPAIAAPAQALPAVVETSRAAATSAEATPAPSPIPAAPPPVRRAAPPSPPKAPISPPKRVTRPRDFGIY